jgi:hypothetical protein
LYVSYARCVRRGGLIAFSDPLVQPVPNRPLVRCDERAVLRGFDVIVELPFGVMSGAVKRDVLLDAPSLPVSGSRTYPNSSVKSHDFFPRCRMLLRMDRPPGLRATSGRARSSGSECTGQTSRGEFRHVGSRS